MMVMTSNSHHWSPGLICGEVKFILLLPWNWCVETMGDGDHQSADSCRMGEVEGVGMVELVCAGRLLRMGCDSFIMSVCGSVGSGEPGSRMGYHGNILLRTNGGRRGRDRKPNSVGGKGRGWDRKLDFVACSARIVSGWVVVAWDTESYSGLAGNTYFVYLALRTSALGMGQTVRLGKKNTLCCKSGMEIYFFSVLRFFIFHLLFIIFYMLNFFRIAKWWWLPWVSAVGLVGESPRVPIAEAPATFGERWGRVGRMMTREWSVSLRVCGVWIGERCPVPWGMGLF